ncbi:MAG: hypothetical protein ACR2N3_15560 [Pyrinomonadaceae bacterium]
MRKQILLYLFTFFIFAGTASAQVTSPSQQQQTEANKTQAQLDAEVAKLTPEQKQLCQQILKTLDKADSVLQETQDGQKFRKTVAEAEPLLKKLNGQLSDGVFKNLMFFVFRTYSDVGAFFVLGQAVQDKGKKALNDEAKKFLADASERYSKIIGKEAASDMLDQVTVAALYALANKTKRQTYKYIS